VKVLRLYDLAAVLRSKNSGPFEITLDVIFDNEEIYYKIKNSGVINVQKIALLYGLTEDKIIELVFFDQALGIKITYVRPVSSGTCKDRDVYGAQQHAPLMELSIDI